jgi:hypothetical protein
MPNRNGWACPWVKPENGHDGVKESITKPTGPCADFLPRSGRVDVAVMLRRSCIGLIVVGPEVRKTVIQDYTDYTD